MRNSVITGYKKIDLQLTPLFAAALQAQQDGLQAEKDRLQTGKDQLEAERERLVMDLRSAAAEAEAGLEALEVERRELEVEKELLWAEKDQNSKAVANERTLQTALRTELHAVSAPNPTPYNTQTRKLRNHEKGCLRCLGYPSDTKGYSRAKNTRSFPLGFHHYTNHGRRVAARLPNHIVGCVGWS
jgi:hypothetical protein